MNFTSSSTVNVQKTLPAGTTTSYNTGYTYYQVEIRNGNTTTIFNPTGVAVLNSNPATSGYVQVSNIPVSDGLNIIKINYHSSSDADNLNPFTPVEITRVLVRKITPVDNFTGL